MDYSKYSNILASTFNTNSSIFSLFDDEVFEKIPHGKLYRFRPCNAREFSSLENNFIWGSSASNFHDFWDSCIYVTNDELLKKQELVSHKLSVHIGIEAIKNTYSNYGLPDTFFEEYKKEILRLDSIFDTDEFWNEVENTYYQPRFQKLLNLIPDSSTDYTKYS